MITIAERTAQPLADDMLRAMFEARKRVFVDLLKWNVPVIENRYEVDQFDDPHAVYLIAVGDDGEHLGSARLLETLRPHILDTLFADLCAAHPPRGPDILEITRFCLDRRLPAARRLTVRNTLVSAIADYALMRGVTGYTGIAEFGWLQQILAFGWRCRPLGLPAVRDGRTLGALWIDIGSDTPALLAQGGVYIADALGFTGERRAA
ncbi:MAG: autoinducer synthase [Sphingobium sp. 32-64-5]|nr:MAG: autoinducer synthase [Sphingomonadales bacterium 12-68-11]OYW87553.1 MAG: autoinducer synthase [Sphingobium sp. 32-64-5]